MTPLGWVSVMRLSPITNQPGPVSMRVSGFATPASRAAATNRGFMVEPGSKVSVTARLRSRAASKVARLLGLKLVELARARISPVLASSTTTAPALAWLRVIASDNSR